jgi:ABC-type transporter Mla MlaB component
MSFGRSNRLFSRMATIDCDLRSVAPDCASLDALARLQLNARRLGLELRLRNVTSELRDLIVFAGLDEVLAVEVGGQAEEREEGSRVEEERELDDPTVL